MNTTKPLHELHFEPSTMSLVIVPVHANEEAAGCGWSGTPLSAKERDALVKELDIDSDDLGERVAEDGEVIVGGETYRMSSDGDVCRVDSWCIFHNADLSTEELIDGAKWVGPDDGAIRVASVLASEYDDGPMVTRLGPLVTDTGTSGYREGDAS